MCPADDESCDQNIQVPDDIPFGSGQEAEVFAGTVDGHQLFSPVVAPAAGGVVGAGTGGLVIELSTSTEQLHIGFSLFGHLQ